jgi:hypothetical protein
MVSRRFLSPDEGLFYRLLVQAAAGRAAVLAQVALNRLLYLPGSEATSPGWRVWHNKIAQKSVDFLLFDPQTLRPIVAVELDDATHAGEKRRQRDADVERLLAAAGLPLARFPARRDN